MFFIGTTFVLFRLAAVEITPYIEIFSLNLLSVEFDKDFSKLSWSNSPSKKDENELDGYEGVDYNYYQKEYFKINGKKVLIYVQNVYF